MKKLILIPLFLSLFVLNLTSCSSSDDSASPNPAILADTVSSGTWKVSSYKDSGVDETSHFQGYNFTFSDNGVLSATNGTNTYNGAWSVIADDSSGLDFTIDFIAPADFAELTEDWDVVSYSGVSLSLVHVSGGSGGTNNLIFTKN